MHVRRIGWDVQDTYLPTFLGDTWIVYIVILPGVSCLVLIMLGVGFGFV